jgi:BirA family transcriptional regulator, biotin operon repressor / biotin---[acetyl-CoA-carboxylase] ligase
MSDWDAVGGGADDRSSGAPWADLTHDAVALELPGRALRSYPALLSTEADASAWAREGAPHGALVVADYQASPRGRGGLPWLVRPGRGLGFSLVLRPDLAAEREGWLYTVASCAISDVLWERSLPPTIRWPDEVLLEERRVAAVGIHAEPGPGGIAWALVTVLLEDALPPRAPLLARTVAAVERRLTEPTDGLLRDHEARCATVGRRVRVDLVPLGPAGTRVEGLAVGTRADGSLAVETGPGRRIAIPPRDLGRLHEL